MKSVVKHETYGEIKYEESFWTGKKKLFIDGKELVAVNKKNFQLEKNDGTIVNLSISGNFMMGVKVRIEDETVVLLAPPAWYDYIFLIIIFAFGVVWGNVPALVKILPIPGGAVGGLICGFATVGYLCISRLIKKPILKFLAFIVVLGLEILIGYAIAMIIISASQAA